MTDMPILVYAFHTTNECGGFDWCPDTPENRAVLLRHLHHDRDSKNYESGTLVALTVNGIPRNWESITFFIEGELQDAIEVASVGKIIERYSYEPPDPAKAESPLIRRHWEILLDMNYQVGDSNPQYTRGQVEAFMDLHWMDLYYDHDADDNAFDRDHIKDFLTEKLYNHV